MLSYKTSFPVKVYKRHLYISWFGVLKRASDDKKVRNTIMLCLWCCSCYVKTFVDRSLIIMLDIIKMYTKQTVRMTLSTLIGHLCTLCHRCYCHCCNCYKVTLVMSLVTPMTENIYLIAHSFIF